MRELVEPYAPQRLAYPLACDMRVRAANPEAQRGVVLGSLPRKQAMVLEYERSGRARARHRPPIDADVARRGDEQSGRQQEQRGFPAAARPYHGHGFAQSDLQGETVEGLHMPASTAIGERYAVERQERHLHGRYSPP